MIKPTKISRPLLLIFIISIILAVSLIIALWDINFWPTDAKDLYLDAAASLPSQTYLSQMHEKIDKPRVFWLHGKEIFVLAVSLTQRLIKDTSTLRPFMLLNILAFCLSSLLIYGIARYYFDALTGFLCYLLFVTSMWPYVYILFAKHHLLGLLFVLASIFLIQRSEKQKAGIVFVFLSGIFLGLAFFSSTVTTSYLGYYAAAFLYVALHGRKTEKSGWPRIIIHNIFLNAGLVGSGVLIIVIYVNYPHVIKNIKQLIGYLHVSSGANHFVYNQTNIKQWFMFKDVSKVRGGVFWIIEYFLIIMPALFPACILSAVYLLARAFTNFSKTSVLTTVGILVVTFSSCIIAETAKVAQYGGNYFPAFTGMLLLFAYTVFTLKKDWPRLQKKNVLRKSIIFGLFFVGVCHLMINVYVFISDIYICRMSKTFLSRKIENLRINHLYTHRDNPHKKHFVCNLKPSLCSKLQFIPIDTIMEPKEGYILIPPVTGDSIYLAATSFYVDFDRDIFLNEMLARGNIEDFAAASYKTLANSKIWSHEEEICSYRNTLLGQHFEDNGIRGRVWLLDAAKIQRDKSYLVPREDYIFLHRNNVRNIGTIKKVYMYRGYRGNNNEERVMRKLVLRLYKVGDPKDSLVAFVYKMDSVQSDLSVPINKHFASRPLPASTLSSSPANALAIFTFAPPLNLKKGLLEIMVFRTGHPDDKNYYRVFNNYLGIK